eukprot:12364390-Prorocentrum_lima.AAC.1
MTSSLVGSEMCIRDSFSSMRPDDVEWSKIVDAHPRQDDVLYQLWDRIDTVSYTHLTLPTICSV